MKSSITRKREQPAAQLRSRVPKRAADKAVRLPGTLVARAEEEARKRHVALDSLVADAVESYIGQPSAFLRELDAIVARMARDRGNKPLEPADDFTREELHERNDIC